MLTSKGYAVAGEDGPIKAVHVSTDEGKSWMKGGNCLSGRKIFMDNLAMQSLRRQ